MMAQSIVTAINKAHAQDRYLLDTVREGALALDRIREWAKRPQKVWIMSHYSARVHNSTTPVAQGIKNPLDNGRRFIFKNKLN
jgi:hypothetical protein